MDPREVKHHAIIRKDYGCTHFIVGRDHAGVDRFYGPYDAQETFDEFDAALLAITPIFCENSFFCSKCDGMASNKTCGHDPSAHISLSGTRVREMLSSGDVPPKEFTCEEVAKLLIKHYWK